jgi:hypothetical protein
MKSPIQRVIFSLIFSLCYGKSINKFIRALTSTVNVGITMAADSPCGDWEPYKDEKCFKIFENVGLKTYDDAEKTCNQQENSSSLVSIRFLEEQ